MTALAAIHVEQIKEIVILMMNARIALAVDQTIVLVILASILNLIAVMQFQKSAKVQINQSPFHRRKERLPLNI